MFASAACWVMEVKTGLKVQRSHLWLLPCLGGQKDVRKQKHQVTPFKNKSFQILPGNDRLSCDTPGRSTVNNV